MQILRAAGRSGEESDLQQAARIQANDTLNSKMANFHCVAILTVERYAAVSRGPPRPEAAPGLSLQTSVDLVQQVLVHTVLANVLWFRLAKVSPLKLVPSIILQLARTGVRQRCLRPAR